MFTTRATILDIESRTADIRVLHLKPDVPVAYDAGQYLQIKAPAYEARPFSIANAPSKDGILTLHVRNMGSGFSQWLGSQAVVGDVVDITGPFGRLHAADATQRAVFMIGGGTGIVPLLALMQEMIRKGITEEGITLLYGVRTADDIHCRRELDALASSGEVTVHYCIGAKTPDTVLRTLNPDLQHHAVYISGPDPMLFSLRPLLMAHGAKEPNIHTDITLNVLTGAGA